MKKQLNLAIIGSGATAIYLLKHMLNHVQILRNEIASISIFEKSQITGVGMPYSPQTTDRFNMSNISSEELPELQETFADWLRSQDDSTLAEHAIVRDEICATDVYDRLALGKYLNAQYRAITEALTKTGIELNEHPGCEVIDIVEDSDAVSAVTSCLGAKRYDMIFIATGHRWDGEDRPGQGYYTSPWPIFKLLPKNDFYLNFTIGTLGASLSAFDVITSLAHRHGRFVEEGKLLRYEPFPGTENFSFVMHAAHGWLPHLQFDQHEPLREIYSHTDRKSLLALRDSDGFLRLSEFFDKVCRPALIKAFAKDDMPDVVAHLQRPEFGIESFVKEMTREHEYANAFEGMKYEMIEARESVEHHKPIHWKEVLDDLMFCLNFHVELLPAEDHLTFHSVVMPFLMNVIAALPLKSGDTLLALYAAGKLRLEKGKVTVEDAPSHDGKTVVRVQTEKDERIFVYQMFVDCSGQRPLEIEDYPFRSLVENGRVSRARARFADATSAEKWVGSDRQKHLFTEDGQPHYLIGGVQIDGSYRVVGDEGQPSPRIYDIAFPHTAGVRPYSYGLQACNTTCAVLVQTWVDALISGTKVESDIEEVSKVYEAV